MNNRLIQIEKQVQQQRLTQLQFQVVRLLELPIADLEQRVRNEVEGNDALEEGYDNDTTSNESAETDFTNEHDEAERGQSEEVKDYFSDDDFPSAVSPHSANDKNERPVGGTTSFIDELIGQISEFDVDDNQRILLEYLIGSLNDDGFIDGSLYDIVDDLEFNHNIECTEQELESVLHILQQFEPAGIGARNQQECLLIQIDRKTADMQDGGQKDLWLKARSIIADYYELFANNNIISLKDRLGVSDATMKRIINLIGQLDPRPGRALCESVSDVQQEIIPDFIIETNTEGEVFLQLNSGFLPPLRISSESKEQLEKYREKAGKSQKYKDAFEYKREQVDTAAKFIEAINLRQRTMLVTMRAIVKLQHAFIITQDTDDIQPMTLDNVAELAGVDISTVSRVKKDKYVQIDSHVYALDDLFVRNHLNADGEVVDVDTVKELIGLFIQQEDKSQPYSDQIIADMLQDKGHKIKRRTVANYRKDMGIPSANKRKRI